MATSALRAQVATKWQDAFTRLNHGEPGISGLMTFSQVHSRLKTVSLDSKPNFTGMASCDGLSTSQGSLGYKLEEGLQCVLPTSSLQMWLMVGADMQTVRAALDMVNRCRRLPVLLETFLGASKPIIRVTLSKTSDRGYAESLSPHQPRYNTAYARIRGAQDTSITRISPIT